MVLTNAFKEAVSLGNVRRVRIMMKDSLLNDPTFPCGSTRIVEYDEETAQRMSPLHGDAKAKREMRRPCGASEKWRSASLR